MDEGVVAQRRTVVQPSSSVSFFVRRGFSLSVRQAFSPSPSRSFSLGRSLSLSSLFSSPPRRQDPPEGDMKKCQLLFVQMYHLPVCLVTFNCTYNTQRVLYKLSKLQLNLKSEIYRFYNCIKSNRLPIMFVQYDPSATITPVFNSKTAPPCGQNIAFQYQGLR